jgi:RecJ-like exonuclease
MKKVKWNICPVCNGDGAHSKRLGVINMDEWGQDELDDYFNGAYDSTCECCAGAGKVTSEQIEHQRHEAEFQRIADMENGCYGRG